ncbi:5-bromo-4-chloroindolyl phosphate hydrolysis family protein [Anaerocolumna xylanovorans]|uniref:5-bromo-4-chloroindolyl phosphate hydrolysis protein n=1 Tax=Anaerocolumna xylanovorans DSM 12503 TaxID=1121345 RepID=A0A1M7YD70_9FIRM|nr:5-bromo-4-chloroindolyl phosphate hydrolysis family protein [Anaerocolumna xylanovorans]SHO50590.1 5-bromo-4-chloroindolyl phosphate hydrolysis protein [Anaerocolumna xylanovorans DSM 12503]
MDRRNFSDLGEEIRDIVQNAVNTKDFHQLNRDIGNTVRGALDEVRNSLGTGYGRYREDNPGDNWSQNNSSRDGDFQRGSDHQSDRGYQRDRERQRDRDYQRHRNFERERQYSQGAAQADNQQRSPQAQTSVSKNVLNQKAFPSEPVGRVSGVLFTVFGSIGMGTFGIGAFVLAMIGQLTGRWGLFGSIAIGLLPFFGVSCCMAARGGSIRKRLQRFRRYIGLFQGRTYYSIKELAAGIGQSHKYVLKDLRRMISIGMFPEGRIDEQETCLMLNRESYSQYLELQKNIRIQAAGGAVKEIKKENQEAPKASADAEANQQVRKAIEAGRICIQQIREANEAIPGEEISRKLDRLEDVIGKIFNYIEQHPDQLEDIQKFMEYYLPTTLKLVNAYREFEKQSIQGENITAAKKEIEETLDTINLAFENLLDSLFVDVAMDVSSDISVLETLLAQEGLTQKDFVSNE